MIESITAVAEVATEITEIAEVCELPVLEPNIDTIQSVSLEALKSLDLKGHFEDLLEDKKFDFEKKLSDENDGYMSTYEERFNQTPLNNGNWEGERGESKFSSNDPEVNDYFKKAKIDGIEYENCIPDFSEVSKGDVQISDMSESRPKNFKQADEQLAIRKNCTPREVSDWREANGYTWHECNDMVTCQKIPSCINSTFGHLGGVSECKKLMSMLGEFDD